MKRIALFLATNVAVVLVLSIVLNFIYSVAGIQSSSMIGLLVLATVFGFGGSFISLFLSKTMAIRSVSASVIKKPRNEMEHWLSETVTCQAKKMGIGIPTIAIYKAEDMNAFATGAKRDDALIAVSTGLLNNMTKKEVEAVLAHEISHVANGDMVTMTLIQGVLNTFVIFFSRFIANIVASNNSGEGEETGPNMMVYFFVSLVLDLVFGLLASIIVMWYSRQREFRADSGAASLVGKKSMISALQRLRTNPNSKLESSMAAFAISGKKSVLSLLMSHPPIQRRIDALHFNSSN
ncbi:protease htpX [Candidatus Photodesmus katoptron]|uniref:Protease HtpX n=1 Tax=Candidatus Photodesmus katoptron Akat1 TaxID=1236703 RepID=S3DG76_9GAMM|nr:protease HtpX [Candidatus Photodesmus katoptron]EPE37427.1 peptidase family M48 [Candidatus Photodesmus katoptron Akat1]KEY90154.1 protease htpX [Candidatus Photodesmus katoptron]